MGDSEFVINPSPFQIMSPDAMTEAKLSTWRRTWVLSEIKKEKRGAGLTWRMPSLRNDFNSSVNMMCWGVGC